MVPDLRSAAGLPAAGGGSANFLSRRGRRRGGDLVFDFCCSFLLAPRRCLLQRRREEGDVYAGAGAAGLLGLAAGWRFRRALPGMRPVGHMEMDASGGWLIFLSFLLLLILKISVY